MNADLLANIPPEMKKLPNWICWKKQPRGDKVTKIPINPKSGSFASVANPSHWTTFEGARQAAEAKGLDGIGFVFTDAAGLIGIDVDGEIDPELPAYFDSYAERSQSGKGVHIICRGKLPQGAKNRTGNHEIYGHGRYFVVTGDKIHDAPIRECQQQVEAFAGWLDESKAAAQPSTEDGTASTGATSGGSPSFDWSQFNPEHPTNEPPRSTPPPADLLAQIRASPQGAKFDRLWAGNLDDAGGDHSRADAALLAILRFWTGGDKAESFALFEQSGLRREKWTTREDYRESTWKSIDSGSVFGDGTAAGSSSGHSEAGGAGQAKQEPPQSVRPYTTRSWGELRGMTLPPQEFFLGEAFALGQLSVILGQGGLGKSRWALNEARNQVLGLPFADLPTGTRPLRHLMMGSENNIHRLHKDVTAMSAGLTDEEIRRLDEHIRLATLENPDDPFITVGDDENVKRWRATLRAFRPNVVWVDPWGDVQEGDANADADARSTLRKLLHVIKEANPNAGTVILGHSRTGANNIRQATGYDAANFMKGSKALYSAARCVFNLAPGDESENPPIVCVHAKNNNGPRHPEFAMRLDPATMTYHVDEAFDLDAWRASVESVANGKRGRGTGKSTRPLEEYRQYAASVCEGGPWAADAFRHRIQQMTKAAEKPARAILQDWIKEGIVRVSGRTKETPSRILYGTPEQIAAFMQPDLPGAPPTQKTSTGRERRRAKVAT